MQWKVFNPAFMTMSGWATPAYKQPWAYGEPYTAINRKYLKLRERLLPYFYTYAAEAHRTGAPLNRSLVLEYPDDPKTWDDTTKYEFLAGKEFLVAPMWGADEVKNGIYLPKGSWVDYWTGTGLPGPDHGQRLPRAARHAAAVRQGRRGRADVEVRHQRRSGAGPRRPADRRHLPAGASRRSRLYEDDRVTRATKSAQQTLRRSTRRTPSVAT